MTPLTQLKDSYIKQQRLSGQKTFNNYYLFLEGVMETLARDPKIKKVINEQRDFINSHNDLLERVDHS